MVHMGSESIGRESALGGGAYAYCIPEPIGPPFWERSFGHFGDLFLNPSPLKLLVSVTDPQGVLEMLMHVRMPTYLPTYLPCLQKTNKEQS